MSNLEVKGDALHFGEGTAKHILTVNLAGVPELHRFTEKGKEAIDMRLATARSKLDAIIAAAEKGDLHPDTRDFIQTNANAFKHGLDITEPLDAKKIERIGKLEKAIAFAKKVDVMPFVDESELQTLRAGLLEHGELGERLINKEQMTAATTIGLEKGEITRLRADAKKLQELMKRPVGNERLINDLLTRNHADAPALLASVDGDLIAKFNSIHGGNLLEHVGALDAKIVGVADSIKEVLQRHDFKGLEDSLKAAKSGTDKAAIVEAERALNVAMREIRELTNTAEGKAAYKLVTKDKDFAKRLGEILGSSNQLKSHLDGTAKAATTAAVDAGKGAKLIGGGKWYSFIHSAESAGAAVEKVGKFRWGKAAAIGIPAAAVVAFVAGNKGPGERAAAVNQGRENEPAMGRA